MKKKRQQGILTVEASIVLVLIIMLLLFLFSFGRVYRAQSLVSHATLQTADAIALESYLRETALRSDAADVLHLASHFTDSVTLTEENLRSLRSADLPKIAREKFIAAVSNSESNADLKLKNLGVKNGLAGIDFTGCTVDLNKNDVIISITYTIEMQFPVFGANELTVTKAAKAKTFGEILFAVVTEQNIEEGGHTSGDASVVHGSDVVITATPNYGYIFVGWEDGVTDNPRTVTVTDEVNYKAIFEKDKFGVNTSVDLVMDNPDYSNITHTNYGSVTGAGTYEYLDIATLEATPTEHYDFAGWDDNGDGEIDDTNATRNIAVDKVYDVKAIFKPKKYTITAKANNDTYGTTFVQQGENQGAQIVAEYGSAIQLIATSKNDVLYLFTKWSNNSPQQTTSVNVEGEQEYTANFELNTYKVTFKNGNTVVHTTDVIRGSSIDGSKSSIGSSMYGGTINNFSRWAKSDNSTFTSGTIVNSDLTVKAILNYTVTLKPNKGRVSWTSKKAEVGKGITLPTPSFTGHTFNGWKSSTGEVYKAGDTVAFNKNVTLTAQWKCRTGDLNRTYAPYCRNIYANGRLTGTAPYREYKCRTKACGKTWKVTDLSLRRHYRFDDSNKDDFNAACNVRHGDTHYGYCGAWAGNGGGQYHKWNGYYHIVCSYCHKEQQGVVHCYIEGRWQYRNLRYCAQHKRNLNHVNYH